MYMAIIRHGSGASEPHTWTLMEGPPGGTFEMYDAQRKEAWLCGTPGAYKVEFRTAEGTEKVLFEIP